MAKILLIEDDTYIRELYEEVLKGVGFEVVVAIDGEVGLEHAKIGGFDLILLDMMLPKLDGLGFLRALKNEPPKAPNGPIIILSNLTHDPVIKMAQTLGASAFVAKSEMDPGEFLDKVRGFLAQAQTETKLPEAPRQDPQ